MSRSSLMPPVERERTSSGICPVSVLGLVLVFLKSWPLTKANNIDRTHSSKHERASPASLNQRRGKAGGMIYTWKFGSGAPSISFFHSGREESNKMTHASRFEERLSLNCLTGWRYLPSFPGTGIETSIRGILGGRKSNFVSNHLVSPKY